jgi:hypothetical protein
MPTRFFRQEIIEVPGVVSSILVTFDGVRDDVREMSQMTLDQFVARMTRVKSDWATIRKEDLLAPLKDHPEKTIKGWEARTIYVIRGGQYPEQWTKVSAAMDAAMLLGPAARAVAADIIHSQVTNLRTIIPVGHAQ